MIRGSLLCLAVFACATANVSAKSDLQPGNYFVSYSPTAASEQTLFLIKVEHKGGKDVAELLDPQQNAELESFSVDGRKVVAVFKFAGRALSFDGMVSEKDPKVIIGTFGDDALITRGKLIPTEKDKIEATDRARRVEVPEAMTKANQLASKVTQLTFKLRQAKAGDRDEIRKQIDEAKKEADEQAPPLYKEVLDKHADSPAVADAVLALLPRAEKMAKPADVTAWLAALDKFAQPYGPRYHMDVSSKALNALVTQKGFEAVTIDAADKLIKALPETAGPSQKVKIYKVLRTAQEKAGKTDLAKQTEQTLNKLEEAIDKEYEAKVPPFKPTKYQGRKEASEKVVVLELFTGAQCPPCVAADVAFDGLMKAYKPTDLVMVQYHMHIPGPDPLTNTDTEARWKYYREKFPTIGGVPSSLFNGKPNGGGGGGMGASENKFKQFRGIIDPLLDEKTDIKMTGNVVAKGDKLNIKVDADGIKEANENLHLRLLLVEESIRYVGGNGIRFHHQVVRSMPGGAEGVVVKDKKGSISAEVDLNDVRAKLKKYLADFEANGGTFSNPDRPLALKHLRVIGMLQDDSTREILQALQLEVPEGK